MKLAHLCFSIMVFSFFNSFGQGGFIENHKLVASDRNILALFGESVKMTSDYLFIGATGNDSIHSNSGAVYVYEKMAGDWLETSFIKPDVGFNDQFGNAIEFENNLLFVSSFFHDAGAIPVNGGAVFIFENVAGNWEFQQKVVSDDIQATDLLGTSISVSGDYLVVGAPRHDYDLNTENFVSESGAVYIFKRTGGNYNQIAKLIAPTRSIGERFGYSVKIDGNDLLIGAYRDDEDENEMGFVDDAGSVYYYRNDGSDNFNLIEKLTASDRGLTDANFGEYLILDGNRLFVRGKTINGRGGIYVYDKIANNWQEQQIIESSNGSSSVANGFALAMDVENDKLLVGSRNEGNQSNVVVGRVSYYKENAGTWTFVQSFSPLDAQSSDLFGYALDIYNDEVVIGANQHDFDVDNLNELNNAGSAYIFNFDSELVLSVNNTDIKDWKLFPNPTNDRLNIALKSVQELIEVSIYNLHGQKIMSKSFNNVNTLQLELNQPNGIYIVEVISSNGRESTFKVVKN